MTCNTCENNDYPHYGCAPHECYWRKEGGFNNPLGTSTINHFSTWPDNFYAEFEPGEKVLEPNGYGLLGLTVCPDCGNGKEIASHCFNKHDLAKLVEEQGEDAVIPNFKHTDNTILVKQEAAQ